MLVQNFIDDQSIQNVKKINDELEKMKKILERIVDKYSEMNKKSGDISQKFENINQKFDSFTGIIKKNPFTTILQDVDKFFLKIKDIKPNIKNAITESSETTKNSLKDIKKFADDGAATIQKPFKKVGESVKDFFENKGVHSIKDFIKKASESIKDFPKTIKDTLGGVSENIKATFESFKSFSPKEFATDMTKKISGAFEGIGDALKHPSKLLTTTFGGIKNLVTGFATSTMGTYMIVAVIIAGVIAALLELWNTNEDWRNSVMEAWNNIQAVLQAVYENVIMPIFSGIATAAMTIWEGGIQPLWNAISAFIESVTTALLDLWNFLSPYIIELLDLLGPILTVVFNTLGVVVGTVFNGIAAVISSAFIVVTEIIDWLITSIAGAKDSFAQVFDGIMKIFNGIVDFITGVFTGDWDKALQGVKEIFSGMWDSLSGIVSGVWETITGLFTNGGEIFSGVVDGIADVFRSIVNSIIKGINNVVRSPFDTVNNLLNKVRSFDIPLIGKPFLNLWGYNPLPIPVIPQLANGGFVPHIGQLFVANEPGNPELVGNIGGRTAVVNNQMILDGIQSAMRNAVVEGMSLVYGRNRHGDTYVDVYVDGVFTERKLIKSNERQLLKTGKPLFKRG